MKTCDNTQPDVCLSLKIAGMGRFNVLPPGMLSTIFGYNYIPEDPWDQLDIALNRFEPICKSSLHFQRINLYRHVRLRTELSFRKFSDSIRLSNVLGGMVTQLYLERGVASIISTRFVTRRSGDKVSKPDKFMIKRIDNLFLRLDRLETLSVYPSSVCRFVISTLNTIYIKHSQPPALITKLDLSLDYSSLDLILPLFPLLQTLNLTLPTSAPDPITMSANRQLTLMPQHTRLASLTLNADFASIAVSTLISLIDAESVTLSGNDVANGLKALTNSPRLKVLHLYSFDGNQELDDLILQFNNIRILTLAFDAFVSPTFFTRLFGNESRLVELDLSESFPLVAADLIRGLEQQPPGLLELYLDVDCPSWPSRPNDEGEWFHHGWTEDCQPEDVQDIVDLCEESGVEIHGAAVDAFRALLQYQEEVEGAFEE
jgi:hypothetical protein